MISSDMTRLLLAIAIALAAAHAAAQQLYRWTDEKGRVHVTDTPPPAGAKDVRRAGGAGGSSTAPADNEPFAVQTARKNNPVTLYSTRGCEACDAARSLLNERGVPFREISVNDEKELEELKKVVGSNSVPALIVGSFVQRGFEPGGYHRALDAAGYPKTGMLPPRKQTEPDPAAPQAEAPAAQGEAPTGPYAPGAPPQRRSKKK
jgi:glutaredoxin